MALRGGLLLRLYDRQLATLVLDLQNNYATMLLSSFCGNVVEGVWRLVDASVIVQSQDRI